MQYIKLLRPLQWSKNLFVFLPIFFYGITHIAQLWPCCITFVVLSMASSAIYILNDMCDVDYDRRHPEKSQRPIASGSISLPVARGIYIALMLLSMAITYCLLPTSLLWIVAIYLVLNHAYCFWLKHIAILDVMIVALGFVLRILAGAGATLVTPSHWIIIMTFLLALFLVLAKRRDDIIKYERTQTSTRHNIKSYNRAFLDQSLTIVASVTLVSYIMYTVDDEIVSRMQCDYIYATSIFVLGGILRYLQLTIVEEKSWSPTYIILHDRFLQLSVIGWLLMFAFIIYG